ncbi:MAG TPA: hypothetical protein VJV75_07815, partial [Candidatus Polarisedimenticolia bacterium]|nr:hypothetical protein [Candidatus Polarisedimenticolia bacterium]
MASSTPAGTGRRRRRRLTLLLPLAALVALLGAFVIACLDVNWRFARHATLPPIRVYAAPFLLAPGTALTSEDLAERLTRLGYRKVEGAP